MPRKSLVISKYAAYHIYARSNNRIFFGISNEKCFSIFEDYLFFLHHAFNTKIHAFTMMSNHIHLLASFPGENLTKAICYFMTETARAINLERGTINHVWGGRNKSTMITDTHHYLICYRYIIQNPLRTQMIKKVEDYPFSSIHSLIGTRNTAIPLSRHTEGLCSLTPDNPLQFLNWLNTLPSDEEHNLIQKGLNRTKFYISKEVGTGKKRKIRVNINTSHL